MKPAGCQDKNNRPASRCQLGAFPNAFMAPLIADAPHIYQRYNALKDSTMLPDTATAFIFGFGIGLIVGLGLMRHDK
jgi:hypothetical protein